MVRGVPDGTSPALPKLLRNSLRISWWAALIFAALVSGSVSADPKGDFKAGVESADLGQWQDAVASFRRAIAGDPQESTDQVFLSGVFSRPYLPHFYLGNALIELGRDAHCEQALVAWQESERQGVVQGFRRQWRELEQGRDDCLKRVLPTLEIRVRQALARARSRVEALPNPMPDSALETRRSSLESELAAAESLSQGSDPSQRHGVGRLGALRQALAKSEAVENAVTELLAAVGAHHSDALAGARARARRSIVDAEGARDALGELEASHPKRRLLEAHYSDLAIGRDRLAAANDLDTLEQIQRSAEAAAAAFDRVRTELAADRRAAPPPPRPTPTTEPTSAPNPIRTPPAGDGSRSTSPERLPGLDPQVRTWIDRGRRLLTDLGRPDPKQGLLTLQHARLSALLDGGEQGPKRAEVESWIQRTQDSMLSLRLLAGIEAYLGGEHRRALSLMNTDLLDETSRAAENSEERGDRDPIRAQIFLFRAAAGLSLFRLGGEVEEDLERRATEDARRSRGITPELEPSAEVFSPTFRGFYAEATGGGSGR